MTADAMTVGIGVDPGRHGAVVAIARRADGTETVIRQWRADGTDGYWSATRARTGASTMALIRSGLIGVLRDWTRDHSVDVYSVVEQAGWYAPGTRRMNCGDAGRLGVEHGIWRAVMTLHSVQSSVVRPQVWRMSLKIPSVSGKAGAIAVASKIDGLDLTPGRVRNPHDGLADAACMALVALDLPVLTHNDDTENDNA